MSKKKKKKDDVIKDEFEKFDFMKTVKNNINNVIKDKSILPIINDLVIRTNKIVIHSYQFLKLYLLHLYENNKPFPIINIFMFISNKILRFQMILVLLLNYDELVFAK
jgi:hypothetical protein